MPSNLRAYTQLRIQVLKLQKVGMPEKTIPRLDCLQRWPAQTLIHLRCCRLAPLRILVFRPRPQARTRTWRQIQARLHKCMLLSPEFISRPLSWILLFPLYFHCSRKELGYISLHHTEGLNPVRKGHGTSSNQGSITCHNGDETARSHLTVTLASGCTIIRTLFPESDRSKLVTEILTFQFLQILYEGKWSHINMLRSYNIQLGYDGWLLTFGNQIQRTDEIMLNYIYTNGLALTKNAFHNDMNQSNCLPQSRGWACGCLGKKSNHPLTSARSWWFQKETSLIPGEAAPKWDRGWKARTEHKSYNPSQNCAKEMNNRMEQTIRNSGMMRSTNGLTHQVCGPFSTWQHTRILSRVDRENQLLLRRYINVMKEILKMRQKEEGDPHWVSTCMVEEGLPMPWLVYNQCQNYFVTYIRRRYNLQEFFY